MNPLPRALLLLILAFLGSFANAQKLEPFDAVRIECPAYPSLEATLFIGALGGTVLPTGESAVLAGLPLDVAERRVREATEARLAVPLGRFRLVRSFHPSAPIRYSGALERGGETFATKGLRLSELLRRAIPTANADLEAVEIRAFDGVRRVSARFGASGAADLELRPGDRVFVPVIPGGNHVYVLGAAVRPGAIDYTPGMTVKDAVARAGGARPDGDPSRVEVHRKQSLLGVLDLALGDAPLERGDVVHLRLRSDPEYVYLGGSIARPNRYPIGPGTTLLRAIDAAGGIVFGLRKPAAILTRIVNGRSTSQTFDLLAIAKQEIPDPVLQRGDRIDIVERRA